MQMLAVRAAANRTALVRRNQTTKAVNNAIAKATANS